MSKNARRHAKQDRHIEDAKDGEVTRLRKVIKRLQAEKQKLISEVSTLTSAFDKNVKFLKGVTKDLSVKDLISAAKKDMNLKELQLQKEAEPTLEEKWKCWSCGVGVLKLLVYREGPQRKYFRKCNAQKCNNRTKPQDYNEEVEGVR